MLIDGIEQGVVAVPQIVIVLGMMFYFSWKLALLALLVTVSGWRRARVPSLRTGAIAYSAALRPR